MGTDQVKTFIGATRRLQKIATNLREFDVDSNKSIMRHPEVYDSLGTETADLLQKNITKKTAGLTWGQGKQTDYGRVKFKTTPGKSSVRVEWVGDKISFVEYGAGLMAYENPYPGVQLDYSPIEKGRVAHSGNRGKNWSGYTNKWWYFSSGAEGGSSSEQYDTGTSGWAPLMPFYETMMLIRYAPHIKRLGYTQYEKAVKRAVKEELSNIITK